MLELRVIPESPAADLDALRRSKSPDWRFVNPGAAQISPNVTRGLGEPTKAIGRRRATRALALGSRVAEFAPQPAGENGQVIRKADRLLRALPDLLNGALVGVVPGALLR